MPCYKTKIDLMLRKKLDLHLTIVITSWWLLKIGCDETPIITRALLNAYLHQKEGFLKRVTIMGVAVSRLNQSIRGGIFPLLRRLGGVGFVSVRRWGLWPLNRRTLKMSNNVEYSIFIKSFEDQDWITAPKVRLEAILLRLILTEGLPIRGREREQERREIGITYLYLVDNRKYIFVRELELLGLVVDIFARHNLA